MKKVKLTESELVHLIKRVITETTPTNVYRRWQGQNNQLGNCTLGLWFPIDRENTSGSLCFLLTFY